MMANQDRGPRNYGNYERDDRRMISRKREREYGGFGGGRGPKRFRSDPGLSATPTVWLGNLAPDTNEDLIANAFGHCGPIHEIRLKRNHDTGKVKGFGFLEFKDHESASRALPLDGQIQILGRPVKVELSSPKPKLGDFRYDNRPLHPGPSPVLGLGNAGVFINPAILNNPLLPLQIPGLIMNPAGGIDLNLLGQISGQFGTPSPLNDGPPPQVQQSRIAEPQRNKESGCRTVFVGNLSDNIDDDMIFEIFQNIGDIKAIRWLNDKKTGRFKGCGFIEFYTDDAAVGAATMNGKVVLGRPMRVDYASNQPSSTRPKDEMEPPSDGSIPTNSGDPSLSNQSNLNPSQNSLAPVSNTIPPAQNPIPPAVPSNTSVPISNPYPTSYGPSTNYVTPVYPSTTGYTNYPTYPNIPTGPMDYGNAMTSSMPNVGMVNPTYGSGEYNPTGGYQSIGY